MKKTGLTLFCALWLLATKAQDFHFVHAFFNPQIVNPAAMGRSAGEAWQAAFLYRGLWQPPTDAGAYNGAAFSLDFKRCAGSSFMSIGGMAQRDQSQEGGLYNTLVRVRGACHKSLSRKDFLSVGVYAGILNYGVNPDRLRFNAQYVGGNFVSGASNGENFIETSVIKGDLGVGLEYYNTERGIVVGGALHHINKPGYSFFDDDANRLGVGGIVYFAIPIIKPVRLNVLYRQQSVFGVNNKQWQLIVGPTFGKPVRLGDFFLSGRLFARAGGQNRRFIMLNALTPTVRVGTEKWAFSLSGDINTVRQNTRLTGGMEASVSLNFGSLSQCINCPRLNL